MAKDEKTDTNAQKAKKSAKRPSTNYENARIALHKDKNHSTVKPVTFKKEDSCVRISDEFGDTDLLRASLAETTGTPHLLVGQVVLTQAIDASCFFEEDEVRTSNAVSAAMLDVAPRDGMEGMLAAQMVAVHNQAMECLRRANLEAQPFEIATAYRTQAIKLLRTYNLQMEALKKYRTGGEQKVTVEHVHVHPGGQAIVGPVTHGGGGDNGKKGG